MANEVKLNGYINNVKKISDKLVTFSVAVGVKQEDGSYKNGFVNCKSNQVEKVEALTKERADVSGWMTAEFWEDKETGKERQKSIVFINNVEAAKVSE